MLESGDKKSLIGLRHLRTTGSLLSPPSYMQTEKSLFVTEVHGGFNE